MKFTGEQLVLGQTSNRVKNDHLARYNFIKDFIKNKIVLDVACGTGYGTRMIKDFGAKKVFGVDLSDAAIKHAINNYACENLVFKCGNAAQLNFEEKYFDVIISFETIEHLNAQTRDKYLNELYRVLKNDGTLILSTPNRIVVSPHSSTPHYPHHIIEYNLKELVDILTKYKFKIFNIFGQRIMLKIYNWSFIRFLMEIIEKRFLKRRINIYWLPTGPQVVKFGRLYEPRYFVLILKK